VLIFEALEPAWRYVVLASRPGLVPLWFSRKPFPHLVVLPANHVAAPSELAHMRIQDLTIYQDGLVIDPPRSKTDQEGEGRNLGIPRGTKEQPAVLPPSGHGPRVRISMLRALSCQNCPIGRWVRGHQPTYWD